MTLAIVQLMVAFILTMVATWTGLLVSVAFLLPRPVAKAEELMHDSPWKCFWQGLILAVVLLIGLGFTSVGFVPAKLFGLGLIMVVGALMTVGAAGLAQTIGKRGEDHGVAPNFNMLVRGSLVFSLALGFPIVGWFVFAPIALVCSMGAGLMAVMPERRTIMAPPSGPPSSDYDLSSGRGAI